MRATEPYLRNEIAILAAAITGGLALRIALVLTSLGSSDVLIIQEWARLTLEHGVIDVYTVHSAINHPPVSLLIMAGLDQLGASLEVIPTDLLRLLQSLCDVVTTILIYLVGRRISGRGLAPALLFVLAPVSIIVSGFHGNSDSMMTMLMVGAVTLAVFEKDPLLQGIVVGLACSIKIVPVFVLTLLAIMAMFGRHGSPRSISRLILGFLIVTIPVFLPPLLVHPIEFSRNVFFYTPLGGYWGVTGLMTELGSTASGAPRPLMESLSVIYSSISKFLMLGLIAYVQVQWKRSGADAATLPAVVGTTLLCILVTANGIGLQYFIWILPFLWYGFSVRFTLAWTAAASLLMIVTYTLWAGEFPWYLANAMQEPLYGWLPIWLGFGMWGLMILMLSRSIRGPGPLTKTPE